MANCDGLISSGITLDCNDINAAIGVEKDLILLNYEDYDKAATMAVSNIESDNTNGNEGGLETIFLKNGATPYTFAGTEYSVQPTISTEVKEDGDSWFIHSILFTSYNKSSKARVALESLGSSRVIAILRDRSTGFQELLGSDQGLKISALDRAYVGAQTSNFYQVTIVTPDIAVVREENLGYLSTTDYTIQ